MGVLQQHSLSNLLDFNSNDYLALKEWCSEHFEIEEEIITRSHIIDYLEDNFRVFYFYDNTDDMYFIVHCGDMNTHNIDDAIYISYYFKVDRYNFEKGLEKFDFKELISRLKLALT